MASQSKGHKFLDAGDILHKRYRIEEIVGVGGMGAVYAATDTVDGDKRVALKATMISIIDPSRRTHAVKNFQKEARMLAALSHPSLVAFHDYFVEGGCQYLVMDMVIGQTLSDVQEAAGAALDPRLVFEWMEQVCDVLEYLHSHDPPILMRDLKPENIMLNQEGKIILIDMGIARIYSPDSQTSISLKGLGSSGYAPAEQYYGGTDPRSDIYSLGATMYFLLTGKIPPPSVKRVAEGLELTSPRYLNPNLPVSVEPVILKMMRLRKDDRYQHIGMVRQALKGAARELTEGPSSAPAPTGLWSNIRARTREHSIRLTRSLSPRVTVGVVLVFAALVPLLLFSFGPPPTILHFRVNVLPPHAYSESSLLERDLMDLGGITVRQKRTAKGGHPEGGITVEIAVEKGNVPSVKRIVEAHGLSLVGDDGESAASL